MDVTLWFLFLCEEPGISPHKRINIQVRALLVTRQELHLPNPKSVASSITKNFSSARYTSRVVQNREMRFSPKLASGPASSFVYPAMSDRISDTRLVSWNVVRVKSPLLRCLASHSAARLRTNSPLIDSLLHES